jgi:hypothetical protein
LPSESRTIAGTTTMFVSERNTGGSCSGCADAKVKVAASATTEESNFNRKTSP